MLEQTQLTLLQATKIWDQTRQALSHKRIFGGMIGGLMGNCTVVGVDGGIMVVTANDFIVSKIKRFRRPIIKELRFQNTKYLDIVFIKGE